MIDSGLKLIDDAVNNRLNSEESALFNEHMKDKNFRHCYLNYLLDEALLSKNLEALKTSPENENADRELRTVYDALNDNLAEEEFQLFNESMKEPEFRKEYLDFVFDEKLLERTFEKQLLASKAEKSGKVKIFSAAILAVAAVIAILLSVSFDKGIVKIDRVYQAWLIEDGKEVQIGKNTVLKAGDHVKVKGSLTFIYPDKTAVTVNDKSEIIMGDFKNIQDSRFELLKGYLTVNSTRGERPAEITTKQSKTVFTDSTFTLSIVNNRSTVEVHRGEVEFYNNFGSNDLVKTGQQAWVKDQQEVSAQKVYIDNDTRRLTF